MTQFVSVGRIHGAFGVRGWVKLVSYTQPSDNLFRFKSLFLTHKSIKSPLPIQITEFKPHQDLWVAQLVQIPDREAAQALKGAEIEVLREEFPQLQDEYYWIDLEGLQVINLENQALGVIEYLFATGSNDVMVVKGQRDYYIPFIRPDIVKEIDLSAKRMIVDWDLDF